MRPLTRFTTDLLLSRRTATDVNLKAQDVVVRLICKNLPNCLKSVLHKSTDRRIHSVAVVLFENGGQGATPGINT